MGASFIGARERLSWAEIDIADFERIKYDFLTSKPHTCIVEPDEDGVHELHKIKLVKPLPKMLTGRAVKTFEDFRAALDLVAYEIAEAAHCTSDTIHFPFSSSPDGIESRLGSACKDFPEDIKSHFRNLKPYEGGDDLLWSVNELCRGSKHKIIVPVGTCVGPIEYSTLNVGGTAQLFMPWWNSEKEELVIARILPGTKIKYNLQITLDIAFGEIKIVKGQPVAAVLHALLSKVSGIIDSTEAEATRIGLF